jgi:hypothetical protein
VKRHEVGRGTGRWRHRADGGGRHGIEGAGHRRGQVFRLSLTGASPQVTPAGPLQLAAIAADPAGNPWAAGWKITNA